MTETLHQRIERRIAELDTSPRAVSVAAGLDPGYVRKLLKRRHMPNSGALAQLSAALKLPPDHLLSGGIAQMPVEPLETPQTTSRSRRPRHESQTVNRDLPIRRGSATLRGDGLFRLPEQAADWLFRPPALSSFSEAYAFVIPNAALRPKFAPGDLAIACPEKPTRKDDLVIVHFQNERDGAGSSVGMLAEDIGQNVVLTLHGHDGNTSHGIEEVSSVHKILSLAEILGAGQ